MVPEAIESATPVRVALLKGGVSGERSVSLSSAAQVARALRSEGYDVVEIDTGRTGFMGELERLEMDVVFICLHGRYGEDGTVQGLCELLGVPYTGSGVLASALAMDKDMSKTIYRAHGLNTPESITLSRGGKLDSAAIEALLGERVVVKPAREGSALGVTIVHGAEELEPAVAAAFEIDELVLVERFVSGVEVTVGVLGNDDPTALPVIEIVPQNEFYDFDAKYTVGKSTHVIPARIDQEAFEECLRLGLEAHRALGCRGVSRSDLIVDDTGACWLLETNTIPGMTETSLLPDAARAVGIGFEKLCSTIVELALDR